MATVMAGAIGFVAGAAAVGIVLACVAIDAARAGRDG